MGTLAQLKANIASDLSRDDLASQTAGKIADAVAAYQNERFWFNVSRNNNTALPAAQFGGVWVEVVAFALSVIVPAALDRPAASCCSTSAYFVRSFSCVEMPRTLIAVLSG